MNVYLCSNHYSQWPFSIFTFNFIFNTVNLTRMPLFIFVMSTGEAESVGRSHGPVELPPEASPEDGQVRPTAQTDHQRVPGDRARVQRSQGECTC